MPVRTVDAGADLGSAVGAAHVREATERDTVGGVRPRYVVQPGSTEEVSGVLAACSAADLAVVARGAGSKLDWGAPPERVDVLLDLGRMDRLLEHAVGDLVVRAQPGLPLADLAGALAGSRQRLCLDEPVPGSTVGGTVATGTSGPLRLLYGTARDLLIGVTVVRADGTVARSGGKVVKNVAGYDLGKLYTGSYGTLGVITEAIFRLHPLPAASAWVTATVPDADAARPLLAAALHSQLAPSAIEVDRPADDGPVRIAVLVEGVPDGVTARAETLAGVLGGTVAQTPPEWWGTHPFGAGGTGVKLTAPVSAVADLLAEAGTQHAVRPAVRGSAAGALYAGMAADAEPVAVAAYIDTVRAAAARLGGSAIVLTAPAAVRSRVDLWGAVPGLQLMRRVKAEFDPRRLLAPGRFVGGI